MGLFSSSMRDKYDRTYSDKELFGRYLKRLVPYKKNIILIAIFMIFQAIAAVIAPLLAGFVTDELILSPGRVVSFLEENGFHLISAKPRFVLIIVAASIFLLLYVLNWVAFSMQQIQSGKYVPFFLENLEY